MNLTTRFVVFSLLLSMLLASCSAVLPAPTSTPAPNLEPSPSPAEPTATIAPLPRSLTVCLGQEPNTLYPLGNLNSAARSVLAAIYDGPIDAFANGYQPVILERIPSIENGDAQLTTITVKAGDQVIDAKGNLAVLDTGVSVLPSGCYDQNCAVTYDGRGELTLSQMVVTFHLLAGLTWSDGTPLLAADSIYAFQLASDPSTPGSKYLIDRTQSYEELDDRSVQWWGKPGFVDPTYADNFWAPAPKHVWGNLSAVDLAKADVNARPALGWGPYVFSEWVPGQYIKLDKNPNYFRAKQGLPRFDALIFRFLRDADSGISALTKGECDVLDSSLRIDSQLALLTEMQNNKQITLAVSSTPLVERLDLGIRPTSYEDGYNILLGDRPDFFGDVRARQAIAYCLDRKRVVDTVFQGYSAVPSSYVYPESPLYNSDVADYPYSPEKGIALLKEAGWVDEDNNPATPLIAQNVFGIPAGTPFVINYWTTSALQRRQVGEILAASLSSCGIQVEPKYFSPNDLFSAGPDGPLFGRKFDLAAYAIGSSSTEPPCAWFITEQIPNVKNNWLGVNISGYSNDDYDLLCQRASRLLPDMPEYTATYRQLQEIFANDLPSIPLYFRLKVVAARPDICNLLVDSNLSGDFWNIEDLDYGLSCSK